MFIFFGLIGLLCILINIYDGFKIKKCFGKNKKLYYRFILPLHIIFIAIFMAMFFTRGYEIFEPLKEILNIVGFGFIVFSFYIFLMFLIIDFIRFIFNKLKYTGKFRKRLSKIYFNGVPILVIGFLFICYGIYNASNIKITSYNVDISENKKDISGLNIAMISDTHIGTTIDKNEIDEIVEKINNLNPDIIFLCGDIFDEGTSESLKEYASKSFSNFKSKYGAYYITGNHEYFSNSSESIIDYIESAGITVLNDEYKFIDNKFYVVGRNDKSISRIKRVSRKDLSDIIKDVNKEYPIILLDHQPTDILTPKNEGIDLQFSGHTHAGQIFPINILSYMANDVNYGFVKDDSYNVIVSSGCGTWGVPIRIGSDTEIVNVKIN